MMENNNTAKKDTKQRLTAFIDPSLIKRAKVRGVLEGLTISEVVEKALQAYAPKIENVRGEHISLKFMSTPSMDTLVSGTARKAERKSVKRMMPLTVPR